jgi:DNA polymerase-3 subunit epsilon
MEFSFRTHALSRRRWHELAFGSAPFVAIDFETADYHGDSACAVALMRVEGAQIVARRFSLLRPPRPAFRFSHIHGITWADVRSAPAFADAWPALSPILDGAAFLAAHNAAFDRRVLQMCCLAAGLPPPPLPFLCTVQLARRTWKLRSAKLPDVCRFLGVQLKHHDPASDAEACARIVLAAKRAAEATPITPAS